MSTHPFRLYGHSALLKVSAVLETLVNPWTGEWMGSNEAPAVTLEPAGQSIDMALLSALNWYEYNHEKHTVFYATSAGFASNLAAKKGWGGARGKDDESVVWKETVNSAIGSLACKLINAAPTQSKERVSDTGDSSPASTLQATWLSRGSGYLVSRVTFDAGHLYLVIAPALASAFIGFGNSTSLSKKMEARIEALDTQHVGIDIVASTMEVSLGEIQKLAKGNVIRLDANVKQSFDLKNSNGTFLGKGYLADVDGYKAVQLAHVDKV